PGRVFRFCVAAQSCRQGISALTEKPDWRPVFGIGAQEKTRTSTAVKPLAPEASVSTNFTTWAMSLDTSAMLNLSGPQCNRCRVDGANDTQQEKSCKPLFAKKLSPWK